MFFYGTNTFHGLRASWQATSKIVHEPFNFPNIFAQKTQNSSKTAILADGADALGSIKFF